MLLRSLSHYSHSLTLLDLVLVPCETSTISIPPLLSTPKTTSSKSPYLQLAHRNGMRDHWFVSVLACLLAIVRTY
jgi:hypothetical protein